MDAELTTLQESLEEARTEIERLQVLAADREAQNVELREALAVAQQQATEAEALRAQLAALQAEVAALRETLAVAQEQGCLAAAKYREAMLAASPDLPPDLVTGESVEEIEATLARARQVVTRIREHLEAQVRGAAQVPTGAPPRSAPDFHDLSPQEKIAFGLRREG